LTHPAATSAPGHLQLVLPFIFNIALILISLGLTGWIKEHVEGYFNEEQKTSGAALPDYAKSERLGALAGWASDIGAVFGTIAVTLTSLFSLGQSNIKTGTAFVFVVAALALVIFSIALRKTNPTGDAVNSKRVVLFLSTGVGLNVVAGVVAYLVA
jgi:hypothetical protein